MGTHHKFSHNSYGFCHFHLLYVISKITFAFIFEFVYKASGRHRCIYNFDKNVCEWDKIIIEVTHLRRKNKHVRPYQEH